MDLAMVVVLAKEYDKNRQETTDCLVYAKTKQNTVKFKLSKVGIEDIESWRIVNTLVR